MLALEFAMSREKKFKSRVRARMLRTGESYTAAKRMMEAVTTNPTPHGAPSAASPQGSIQKTYEENRREFREESLSSWRDVVNQLSGTNSLVSWKSRSDILKVLKLVADKAPLNHTMHPGGGGLDLTGAVGSREENCIDLDFQGTTTIVLPISLTLVAPANDPLREWAYFRLETGELKPSGVYDDLGDLDYEEVLELRPGVYVERYHSDAGFYGHDEDGNEVPLPRGARVVSRVFRGSFVVVAKASTYNCDPENDAYDGRHARMSPDEFRTYIERQLEAARKANRYGFDVGG